MDRSGFRNMPVSTRRVYPAVPNNVAGALFVRVRLANRAGLDVRSEPKPFLTTQELVSPILVVCASSNRNPA